MIKAVIFDMDGVIIDSELIYLKFFLKFFRKKNSSLTIEHLFGMVGASKEDAWSVLARAVNNGQTWEELRAEYREFEDPYSQIDYTKIFRPEITGILKKLKECGYKLALASSTQLPIIRRVLDENDIAKYFEVVVSGSQFQRSKPDPEIYHYTAGQLEVKEKECFVIEDSTFGIQAAHRAGMTIAALTDLRFGFDQSLADYHIKELDELSQILCLRSI